MLTYPRCPEVHYNRGLAFRKLGKLENAIIDYTQSIALDPRLAAAYANRGYAHFKLSELENEQGGDRGDNEMSEALADFEKVLELEPTNAEALKSKELIQKMQQSKSP